MKEDKTVPQLRFPEFTDAWKQCKLSDLVNVIDGDRGKNYPTEADFEPHGHTLFLNASNVTIDGFLFDTNQFITEEKSNSMGSGKIIKDDIIITSRGSLGHIAWYNDSVQQVMPHLRINSGMLILRNKANVKTSYLHQFMKSDKGKAQIVFMSFGSAQPQLTKKGVESFTVNYPIDTEEQIKIGAFFSKLDNTITLQQRKLNSLQKLKKGLLQKMFPKNGENIPEIRFPEFSDAWKQRKFGDVLVSIQTGTNKLGSDRNSGQPLLKMGNLQSGYFDLSKLEFLENKAEPENIVKQGDFFFNTRNTLELVGKGATWFGESNKYAFNSNIARFTLKDINTGFFNYLYNTNYVKKQIRARAMGTTSVAAIYPRSLKSVDIVIPNMEEQIKLSNLFMNLDSTITLQQRKLESLQKLKKGLLQQMFI